MGRGWVNPHASLPVPACDSAGVDEAHRLLVSSAALEDRGIKGKDVRAEPLGFLLWILNSDLLSFATSQARAR